MQRKSYDDMPAAADSEHGATEMIDIFLAPHPQGGVYVMELCQNKAVKEYEWSVSLYWAKDVAFKALDHEAGVTGRVERIYTQYSLLVDIDHEILDQGRFTEVTARGFFTEQISRLTDPNKRALT